MDLHQMKKNKNSKSVIRYKLEIICFFAFWMIICNCSQNTNKVIDVKVEVYENNNFIKSLYFNKKNQILKETTSEFEINYYYSNTVYDSLTSNDGLEVYYNKFHLDYLSNLQDLTQKNMKFESPYLFAKEINDISNLLANTKNYKITEAKNTSYYISQDTIGKVIPKYSLLQQFLPLDTEVIKYKLALKHNKLVEDEVFFSDGIITRSFIYLNNRLQKKTYTARYKNKDLVAIKEYEYKYIDLTE
ncbi:MAG: hypothetical protein ACOCWM_04150 [Cyclobacteriaceae bacterium]